MRIITPELVARAQAVLQPWSRASAEERILARQILQDAERQRLRERISVSNSFRPQ